MFCFFTFGVKLRDYLLSRKYLIRRYQVLTQKFCGHCFQNSTLFSGSLLCSPFTSTQTFIRLPQHSLSNLRLPSWTQTGKRPSPWPGPQPPQQRRKRRNNHRLNSYVLEYCLDIYVLIYYLQMLCGAGSGISTSWT